MEQSDHHHHEADKNIKGGISMVEANLPPGFRFHPRDDELVCDYLMMKVGRCRLHSVALTEVDLNKCEPWDIPQMACVGGKDWYFYSQRDRKYATGHRTNRATATGYWKATGKDRTVLRKGNAVGMRKTLVFYKGRAPKGHKTDWVMHEFRLHEPFVSPTHTFHSPHLKEDWVLCRVFQKNRDGSTKDSIGNYSDETGSSSPCINFTQSNHQKPSAYLNEDYIFNKQVPCFSILSQGQNHTNPALSNLTGLVSDPNVLSKTPNPLLTSSTPATGLDSFCPDPMVLRSLFSQLNNIDDNTIAQESKSFGEGSSDSLLTEIGIPSTAWNY